MTDTKPKAAPEAPVKQPAKQPETAAAKLQRTQCWSAGRVKRFLAKCGDEVADQIVAAKHGGEVQRILDRVADEQRPKKKS